MENEKIKNTMNWLEGLKERLDYFLNDDVKISVDTQNELVVTSGKTGKSTSMTIYSDTPNIEIVSTIVDFLVY